MRVCTGSAVISRRLVKDGAIRFLYCRPSESTSDEQREETDDKEEGAQWQESEGMQAWQPQTSKSLCSVILELIHLGVYHDME